MFSYGSRKAAAGGCRETYAAAFLSGNCSSSIIAIRAAKYNCPPQAASRIERSLWIASGTSVHFKRFALRDSCRSRQIAQLCAPRDKQANRRNPAVFRVLKS
jgi:hypothetical protein